MWCRQQWILARTRPRALTLIIYREAATNEVQMRTNAIGGSGSALLADAMKRTANGTNTLTELKGYVSVLI